MTADESICRPRRTTLYLVVITMSLAGTLLAGCGDSTETAMLRDQCGDVAAEASDAAALADNSARHKLSSSATREQAQALAKRFAASLKLAVGTGQTHGSRLLAGNIAVLALDGQQVALLMAGDPSNDEVMPLRRDRLIAIASNARALAASE